MHTHTHLELLNNLYVQQQQWEPQEIVLTLEKSWAGYLLRRKTKCGQGKVCIIGGGRHLSLGHVFHSHLIILLRLKPEPSKTLSDLSSLPSQIKFATISFPRPKPELKNRDSQATDAHQDELPLYSKKGLQLFRQKKKRALGEVTPGVLPQGLYLILLHGLPMPNRMHSARIERSSSGFDQFSTLPLTPILSSAWNSSRATTVGRKEGRGGGVVRIHRQLQRLMLLLVALALLF
ncbi:uncharacterized protein LOC118851327 [Trichosurus vulpecula]|uniref:uncharacterized protein LOC118851327 n=1 Tax=Trichosurus vulpecula TaxID=9337 RepID=UPI00186B3DB3|nr:uncharacterized protein LOC118851327 [Trichosurus vulpecula]